MTILNNFVKPAMVDKKTKELKRQKLFVYGLLMKGSALHDSYMRNSEFVMNDSVVGSLKDLGSYSGFTRDGRDIIVGETYLVDEKTLRVIDTMESGAGYSLEKIKTESGDSVKIFVYIRDIQ